MSNDLKVNKCETKGRQERQVVNSLSTLRNAVIMRQTELFLNYVVGE